MSRVRFHNNHKFTKIKQGLESYLNLMKELARSGVLEGEERLELENEMKLDEMEEEMRERELLSLLRNVRDKEGKIKV